MYIVLGNSFFEISLLQQSLSVLLNFLNSVVFSGELSDSKSLCLFPTLTHFGSQPGQLPSLLTTATDLPFKGVFFLQLHIVLALRAAPYS